MNVTRVIAVGVYTTSSSSQEICFSRTRGLTPFVGSIRQTNTQPLAFNLVWEQRGTLRFTGHGILEASSGNAYIEHTRLRKHSWRGV